MIPQEKDVVEPVPLTQVIRAKLIKYSFEAFFFFFLKPRFSPPPLDYFPVRMFFGLKKKTIKFQMSQISGGTAPPSACRPAAAAAGGSAPLPAAAARDPAAPAPAAAAAAASRLPGMVADTSEKRPSVLKTVLHKT